MLSLLLKAGRRSLMAASQAVSSVSRSYTNRKSIAAATTITNIRLPIDFTFVFAIFLLPRLPVSGFSCCVLSWSVAPSRQLSKQLLTRIHNSPPNHTQPCLLRPHPWKLASRRSWLSAPNSPSSKDNVLCGKRSSHQPAKVEMQQRYVEEGHIKVRPALTPLAHLSLALAC